jgi:predicted protein tyrosine phosphatase
MIHVCSLALLPDIVRTTRASHIITVMADVHKVQRPPSITADNHLVISMDDITVPADGFVAPQRAHVEQVLDFGRRWDRTAPLVIHCYAGISRSTASAFAIACALNPEREEAEIARRIRRDSPTAHPNRLIVSHADDLLGRKGRMLDALEAIGPGDMSIEGRPFRIDLD